jgi:hypothetical protein
MTDLLTNNSITVFPPSVNVDGRAGLYDVSQAFSISNPMGDTVPADAIAFRGSYGSLGTWELPMTVRAESSTLIPVIAPLALPAMPDLASVTIYN